MCAEVWRVRIDEARDRSQTKTKNKTLQHDFQLVIYVITIKLSFRIEKGFCALLDNSLS